MFNIAKTFPTPALLPPWLTQLCSRLVRPNARPQTQPQSPGGITARSLLTLEIIPVQGQTDITHLQVTGAVDRFTYTTLIDQAVALHSQGCRRLLLDLRRTQCIELSGLFALLSIARLYSGESLLDPEGGWAALRLAAAERTPTLGQRVKLLATPALTPMIRNASFCDIFELYAEVPSAVAAFSA